MRVLQLAKFYPPALGGMEAVTATLTRGLNRDGIATDVLCAHTSRRSVEERLPAGYHVFRAASHGVAFSTSLSFELVRQLRARIHEYDIVHVHLPNPLANLALLLASTARTRIVVHWHSDVVKQQRLLKLYEPLQTWLLRRADRIIATSSQYLESSPWLRPYSGKCVVIPIGIDDPRPNADPALVAELRARNDSRTVVFSVGRMAYYKGFSFLIRAAKELDPAVQVVIAGGGELFEPHRRMAAQLGVESRITFAGPLSDRELCSHYEACDVFCLPSIARSEAFGVVLLEAMAFGKPVIATRIEGSGVPWVNGDSSAGTNVPPEDVGALANAIQDLHRDPALRSRMGLRSRLRFEEHFRADVMVRRTADLYRELMTGTAS